MPELIARYIEASNASDWEALAAVLHEDLVHDRADGERTVGRDAFREHLAARRSALDLQLADAAILGSDDETRGAAELTLRGTSPDGRSFAVPAGEFYEIEDGRILRITTYASAALAALLDGEA